MASLLPSGSGGGRICLPPQENYSRPKRITSKPSTRTANGIKPLPIIPQMVDVNTVMRKSVESETPPSALARMVTM